MTDIIMIKITNTEGDEYNLNLNYVMGIEFPNTRYTGERIYMENGAIYTVDAGTWAASLASLKAEYSTSPKVSDHLFIGTT